MTDRALQVTQLKALTLLWRAAQHRLGFVQRHCGAFPYCAPDIIYMLVVQDGKQPRSKIRSLLPKMQLPKSAGQAVLYEIIGADNVAR
jgi:hypothetical protein